MNRTSLLGLASALTLLGATGAALAHAQLQKAVPAVGASVPAPQEIRLKFSEAIEPKFSSVTLSAASGAQALGPASLDPADSSVLVARIAKPLPPGTYTVNWRAVSVDTHRTQGSFQFTVKP